MVVPRVWMVTGMSVTPLWRARCPRSMEMGAGATIAGKTAADEKRRPWSREGSPARVAARLVGSVRH